MPAVLLRRLREDQKIRFLVVGCLNAVIGYSAFAVFHLYVFDGYRFGYLSSLAAAYAVAISIAFVLYRRLVFRVRGQVVRDFAAFLAVNSVAIATNSVILAALVESRLLSPLPAQFVAAVVTALVSYFGHRDVAFRR